MSAGSEKTPPPALVPGQPVHICNAMTTFKRRPVLVIKDERGQVIETVWELQEGVHVVAPGTDKPEKKGPNEAAHLGRLERKEDGYEIMTRTPSGWVTSRDKAPLLAIGKAWAALRGRSHAVTK